MGNKIDHGLAAGSKSPGRSRRTKGVEQIIGTLQTHIGADRRSARECAGGSRNSQLNLDLIWIDWLQGNSFRLSNLQDWAMANFGANLTAKLPVRPCGAWV